MCVSLVLALPSRPKTSPLPYCSPLNACPYMRILGQSARLICGLRYFGPLYYPHVYIHTIRRYKPLQTSLPYHTNPPSLHLFEGLKLADPYVKCSPPPYDKKPQMARTLPFFSLLPSPPPLSDDYTRYVRSRRGRWKGCCCPSAAAVVVVRHRAIPRAHRRAGSRYYRYCRGRYWPLERCGGRCGRSPAAGKGSAAQSGHPYPERTRAHRKKGRN
jgi:hypothetical protein